MNEVKGMAMMQPRLCSFIITTLVYVAILPSQISASRNGSDKLLWTRRCWPWECCHSCAGILPDICLTHIWYKLDKQKETELEAVKAELLRGEAHLEDYDQGITSVSRVFRGASVSVPQSAFGTSGFNLTQARNQREVVPYGMGYAYVALGDSYSAGIGGAFWSHMLQKVCVRDVSNSWPALVAKWLYSNHSFDQRFSFWHPQACSGYTTFDVHGMVDYLKAIRVLSEGTQYITLTVGGNDISFAEVISQCVKITGCHDAADNACSIIQQNLYSRLKRLYEKIAHSAPNAKIVVAGYPDIVPYRNCMSSGVLTPCEREHLRFLVNPLNNEICKAVKWAQQNLLNEFVFVDVRPDFYGHEPCSGYRHQAEYVNPIVVERYESKFGLHVDSSFHPNGKGQRAYATGVIRKLNS